MRKCSCYSSRMVQWGPNPPKFINWPQQRAKSAGWPGSEADFNPWSCSAVPAHPARARWCVQWGILPCTPSNAPLGIFCAYGEQLLKKTHGKTNRLLAWISIQRGIFFTRNSAALRTDTPAKPFSLPLIYLLFTHTNNNPTFSLLYSAECRQDGKEVTLTAPNWFMYLAKSDYRRQTRRFKINWISKI